MHTKQRRSLHLIDIENLLGLPRPGLPDVAECRRMYQPLVGDMDLVVVACNHGAFPAVGWGWPGARHLVRSGANGADEALLDVLRHERVEHRFGAVIVASGDGIFTDAVAHLGGRGIDVTVGSRPEALSRRLRLAAGSVLHVAPLTSSLPQTAEPA